MTTAHGTTRLGRATRATRLSRRLAGAVAALVATDLVGGLLAGASGVNTWAEAWGSRALLAAPVPMIVGQVLLAWAAVRLAGRPAAVAAGLLAAACLVSVISGFFDGGLGNDALTPALTAYQVFLLAVTATVGVLAARRSIEAATLPAARA
jgi:hypothetical protein